MITSLPPFSARRFQQQGQNANSAKSPSLLPHFSSSQKRAGLFNGFMTYPTNQILVTDDGAVYRTLNVISETKTGTEGIWTTGLTYRMNVAKLEKDNSTGQVVEIPVGEPLEINLILTHDLNSYAPGFHNLRESEYYAKQALGENEFLIYLSNLYAELRIAAYRARNQK